MKIIIKNFRHYQCSKPKTFNIRENSLTRIIGDSGKGKSTIFMAIFWCLYGGLRGNAVKPIGCSSSVSGNNDSAEDILCAESEIQKFGASPSATVVILILNTEGGKETKIKRRIAATSAVEVELPDNILISKTAEDWIVNFFGSKHVWLVTSYIQQKTNSLLISASNAEKFTILFELAFGSGDDINTVLNKIADKLASTRKAAAVASASLASTKDARDNHVKTCKISLSGGVVSSSQNISELKNTLAELSAKEKTLCAKIQTVEQIKHKTDLFKNEISNETKRLERQKTTALSSEPKFSEDDKPFETITKNSLTEYSALLNKYDETVVSVGICEESDVDSLIFLGNISDNLAWLDDKKRDCLIKNIVGNYNPNDPSVILTDVLTEALQCVNATLKNIAAEIEINEKITNGEDFEKIKDELTSRRGAVKRIYVCGNCGSNVDTSTCKRVVSGKKYTDSEIKNIHAAFTRLETLYQILEESKKNENTILSELKKYGHNLSLTCSGRGEGFDLIFKTYKSLKNVFGEDSSFPSNRLSSKYTEAKGIRKFLEERLIHLNNMKIKNKVFDFFGKEMGKEILSNPSLYASRFSSLAFKIQKRESFVNNINSEIKDTAEKLKTLSENFEKFSERVGGENYEDLENIKTEYSEVKEMITSANENISKSIANSSIEEFNKQINVLTELEKSTHEEAGSMKELLKFTNSVATETLTDTINTINTLTNSVLCELFDKSDPLQIELTVVEKKSTSASISAGNSVSLTIAYKGAIYDGPPLISGGEMDRLSCALTIALASISSTPVVIFDEAMSSVTSFQKEKCIEAVRKFLPSKTVIEVSHLDVPSAFYDETIGL